MKPLEGSAMTEPRKPGFVLPVAVTLAVLLALYVGAYYAMVRPFWSFDGTGRLMSEADYSLWGRNGPAVRLWVPQPSFRSRVFAPINWLDRHIRPHVWEATP
jgi:hypothetical protein